MRGDMLERRGHPRICEKFPVKISGVDEAGAEFKTDAILDNLSASGLYVRLPYKIDAGAKLSFIIRISPVPDDAVSAPRVAAKGVVMRAMPEADGLCGVGVSFTQHRFL